MKRRINRAIHYLFLTCPEATLRIEKKIAGEISPTEEYRLQSHLSICKWCRAYQKKSLKIDRYLSKIITEEQNFSVKETIDTEKLKTTISERLKKN